MTGGNPRKTIDLIEKLEPKKGRLICIDWYDATAFNGWWDLEDLDKEAMLVVNSIGIEVLRDDKAVLIAQSVDTKNDQYRNLQMISISCIIKEEVIEDE